MITSEHRQALRPAILMVTQDCEWERVLAVVQSRDTMEPPDKNIIVELEYRKRHVLFPPIIAGQFIPGSPEFIPVYHDNMR
ncbi:hypothetical protein HG536_0D04140 [Torulaspora globosa]|uniref:Uncharacterized protein n=1 Tax=Torulaspora globosa TaxID=48254 RepID=A0A7G3ZHA6_9SACH|nr:uncharacterized protein HG536_0D04140 [Torulaspora globosa]QLL32892.1 hypothetical protein HG536_0D04140 [Torulaspora globosa]